MRWTEIIKQEPKLEIIYQRARNHKKYPNEVFCANAIWFGHNCPSMRNEVEELVGWFCKKPKLTSSKAYDIATDKIFRALPNCEGCSCG